MLVFEGDLTDEQIKNLPFVTDGDVNAAMRSIKRSDGVCRLVSSYFKRKYVGEWTYNERGKPISENLYFNLSHGDGIVVFARSEKFPIGVDVERIRPVGDALKRYALSDEEYAFIDTDEDFFTFWTAKESLAKAHGGGIDKDVKNIPALPVNGEKIYEGKPFFTHTFIIGGCAVSITLGGSGDFGYSVIKEVVI